LKDKSHTLQHYVDTYANDVVTFALFDRTGILSPNNTLRQLSTNLLVILGIYGKLELFIGSIAKILSYKPLELIAKLEILFEREFDRISYYDLMFYSEMTKDLLTVFSEKDKQILESQLSDKNEEEAKKEGEDDEEEKSSEYIDPAKLMAQQLKKSASQKKAPAKKGAAPVTKAA
jgi:hypothetical protein